MGDILLRLYHTERVGIVHTDRLTLAGLRLLLLLLLLLGRRRWLRLLRRLRRTVVCFHGRIVQLVAVAVLAGIRIGIVMHVDTVDVLRVVDVLSIREPNW